MRRENLLAYFGHHKCATQWVKSIIAQVCRSMNLKFVNVHNSEMFNKNLDVFVRENNIDFLSYINADIRFVNDLDNFLGFHLIRDPRDIAVSAYFSHLYSHPTDEWSDLIEHREKLKKVSKEEGLFLEMEFSKGVFENLYDWNYSQQNIMEIKMEELIKSPDETMMKMFSFLKLTKETSSMKSMIAFMSANTINTIHKETRGYFPLHINLEKIPARFVSDVIYRNRFEAKAKGRKPGAENSKSHYRKGISGDWVNHFSAEHCDYFRKNYNDLLIKLGYEKTADWKVKS